MTTTIVHSAGTIVPTALDAYRAHRAARTLVHGNLNRADDDITLRDAALRAGDFRLTFETTTAAFDALTVLSRAQPLTLINSDVPSMGMAFVVADGDLDIQQDDTVTAVWYITVPFTEVTP